MCDLDDVIGMVQASTQIQEQKMESLETIRQKIEEFVEEAVRIDEDAQKMEDGLVDAILEVLIDGK